MLILFIYTALAVVMTWPVAGYLGSRIPGSDGDAWVHLWTFRWVRDALASGRSPYFSNDIFYPQGTSLTWHNIAWFHIAIWSPLQLLMSEEAAYSLVFLGVFIFNGFAVYLLVRDWTRSDTAAFIAGLIGTFWPYILSHHHHPNLNLIAWVPLALIFLKRTLEQGQFSDAIITAVFVALIGISRWQMLVLGGILLGLYTLWTLVTRPATRNRRTLLLILLIGLVALLIMLPLLWPLISSQLAREFPSDLFTEDSAQSDLLAYIIPSRYQRWWGEAVYNKLYGNFQINKIFSPFLGYTALALAIVGILKQWRKARFWILAALLYLLLALGSELLINGKAIMPLPYSLLESNFLFRIVRHPDRFNVILVIPIAMLAALGFQWLLAQPRLSRWAGLLLLIVSGLILVEYVVDFPTLSGGVPAWYEQLAQEEGDADTSPAFAILELPLSSRLYDEYYMRYQMVHGKPLVNGMVARPGREAFAFIDSLAMLQGFPGNLNPPAGVGNIGSQLRILDEAGVRYLILHKSMFGAEKLQAWQDWINLKPIHEDDDLVVYKTSVAVGSDVLFTSPILEGIGLISAAISPATIAQDGWLNLNTRWANQEPVEQDYDVCLSIVDAADQVKQRQCQALSPPWPTGRWEANELIDESYDIHFDPFFPEGSYTVTIGLSPVGSGRLIGRPLFSDQVEYNVTPRVFLPEGEPPPEKLTQWGDQIALLDNVITTGENNTLEVALRWLALQRMGDSYKVFVHLIDEDSGEIVKQVDTVPREWRYPTNWWEQGEIIDDSLSLPLADVEPGRYSIWLGLYNMDSGERLPIYQPTENQAETVGNALRLGEISR